MFPARRLKASDHEIPIQDLRNGYYLLLAEARYAPCVAAMKFAVSHVAVYLRTTRNQVTVAAVTARVRPVQRLLTVEVTTDKLEYRPADKCVAEVQVLDHVNRPVPHAEVSLGVVQTPIYQVRNDPTPDLQTYFHVYSLPHYARDQYDYKDPLLFQSMLFWKGPKYTWGNLTLFGEGVGSSSGSGHGSFGSRSGGGRHGGRMVTTHEPRLREDFKNTAFWVADLVTGADGKARAEFKFPDDITEWRFTARSLTAETLVGEVRVNRQTLLPLQAELVLPRALREGDSIRVAAMIHENANMPRTVTASGTCMGTVVKENLSLQPRASVRLEIPVAPSSTGELRLTTQATDTISGDGDASTRTMKVLPPSYRSCLFMVHRRSGYHTICGSCLGAVLLPRA
ncbi:MAG: alpha-2-macroglobulin family protein [Planctomycetota bacterium]